MKVTVALLLSFGLFQLCSGQTDEIPAITNPATAVEETASGEADPNGGPPVPGGSQRTFLGGSSSPFGSQRGIVGGPTIPFTVPTAFQCPLYTGPPKLPKCPAAFDKKCPWKYCWKMHNTGLFFGLPLKLQKSILLRGKRCTNENSPCSKAPRKANCRCKTTFTWFGLRRIVVLDGKYYVVKVYWRRASGCDCRGKRKNKTIIPPWLIRVNQG